ncbi:MAG: sulfotransferase [Proteobacteria bacterium]|nr:sulfotransferase [Pseudomonadota bacterium]
MLPNFICIGAQKSGTTTIWHILDAHPNVCMAQPRETRFFLDDARFIAGIRIYEIQHFSHWRGQAAVGEKCPEYLYTPSVAGRISETPGMNDMRFIVALRSPAQRAYSHYRHNMTMLLECRSFEEVLASEIRNRQEGILAPAPYGYLARGDYTQQLKRYYSFFPRDRFLIVNFEKDVVADQRDLADQLFDFLGIERSIPEGLPFAAGHPRLEDLSIRISQKGNNTEKHYVEINRGADGFRRMLRMLKTKKYDQRTLNDNKSFRIYGPSNALLEFAYGFRKNKPSEVRLSRAYELEINHRYYQEEIDKLSSLIPDSVTHWLED